MDSVKERGSEHYKKLDPQPIDVMVPWVEQGMAYELSQVLKYVSRMSFVDEAKAKNDAEKAKHFIDLFLDRWFDTPEGGLGPEVFGEDQTDELVYPLLSFVYKGQIRQIEGAWYNPRLGLVFGYDIDRRGIRSFKPVVMEGNVTVHSNAKDFVVVNPTWVSMDLEHRDS